MFRNLHISRTYVATLAILILLTACVESERPQPTGSAFFRGVNAITAAPGMTFLIEERTLGVTDFKDSTIAQAFDDFPYNINFDTLLPDNFVTTRIATTTVDTVADQNYLFVLAGELATPQIFVWQYPQRVWEGTETVFQLDFGHAAGALGEVDVYFDVPGTVPVLGNAVGSLQYGEILAPMDIEAADYELIVTPKDDPTTIIYQSIVVLLAAQTTITAALFDADPSITAQLALSLINSAGNTSNIPDANFPPTIRFLHSALGTVNFDVSVAGDTANPIATDVAFGEVSADVEVLIGPQDYTYTEAGNPGVILLERPAITIQGLRYTHILSGAVGSNVLSPAQDDRRPRDSATRVRVANMSLNHPAIDVYLLAPAEDISEISFGPQFFNSGYPLFSSYVSVSADDYDLYVTAVADRSTVLAGPIPEQFLLRENIEIAILDNVDPAIVDVLIYSR